MSLLAPRNPENVPLNVLFPEQYAASARMVARDFAFFGLAIVTSVVGLVAVFG